MVNHFEVFFVLIKHTIPFFYFGLLAGVVQASVHDSVHDRNSCT